MSETAFAYATLQVIPSMRGSTAGLEREFTSILGSSGRTAGRTAGAGVAAGLRDSRADVEKASATLAAARDREADVAGKVRVAETRLQELRDSGKASATQLARAEEQLATAMRGRETASRNTTRAAEALENATRDAARAASSGGTGRDAGEAVGGNIASGLGEKLSGMLGGKAGIIGGAVAGAIGLVGLSVPGLFAAALQKGMDNQKSLDMTQARLGVDDATMAKIGTAAGRAYTSGFGESVGENLDTVRQAIQSGLLDEGASAQETQAVVAQLSTVSSLMGEEIPAVARAAGQAIKTGIAGTATEAFDLFTAAEQNGLNVSEDFLDTITEYGTQFRKLGLSGPEAVGLINQAVKAGARDTDVAADAIKEFSIRVVDGSESTAGAFEELGFKSDDLATKFAAGGTTARAAVGGLLAKIREIEDPVKKNEISLALFGTQFEDLGDALNQMNLDTAVEELGTVGGAADAAMKKLGGGAANSIENAKRSIETSTDAISNALAKAFGPELAKLADWVTQHQPEIIGFLGKVVEFAFKAGDGFLAFSATALRALAAFADGAGSALGSVLNPLGKVTEVFGKLTGNDDIENLGKDLGRLQTKFSGAADTARTLADGIDNTLRPKLTQLGQTVGDNIEQTKLSEQMFRALGTTVTTLPDGHTITLKDNTPETEANLEALGLKVNHLPDKTVTVTANTADGQKVLDAFVTANSGRQIPMTAEVQAKLNTDIANIESRWNRPIPGEVPGRAGGGLFRGAGGPREDANLVAISDTEYIVNARATAANLPLLDAINAGWTPSADFVRAMVAGPQAFADGGVAGNRAKVYASSKAGAPYVYGSDLDCSGFMSGIYNSLTGKSVRFTTASDFAQFGFVPGLDANGFSIGTNGGEGTAGHMSGTLLGTNVESDGTNGVQVGGNADGAANFPKVWHLPRELWAPPESDDPTSERGAGLGSGGANGNGVGGSDGGLTSGGSGSGTGGGAGSGTSNGGATATRPTGTATPVWVDNWPSNYNTSGGATTPTSGTTPADGGTTPADTTTPTDQATTTQDTYTARQHPLQGAWMTGDLFTGDAPWWYDVKSPQEALANLQGQAQNQWSKTQSDFQTWAQDSWKEMLSTGAAVLGMGATSAANSGDTININVTQADPMSAASAVERVLRRKTLAQQRSGGMGR
ncbi:phage tail tape measure protein [Nocardia sp. NPDC059240]|uniref:phage tail tape measure protein n=1 Tax=Nocardia sp. NPDC059240 TaxID=3346786 RepID=UPI003684CA2F